MSVEDLELDIRSCLEGLDSVSIDRIPEKKKTKPKNISGRRLRSEDKDSSDVQIIEQPKSIRLLKIQSPNKKKQQKLQVKLSKAKKKAKSQNDDLQVHKPEKGKQLEKEKIQEQEKQREDKFALIMMSFYDFINNWQNNMRKMLEYSTKLKNELQNIQQSQKKKDKK